MRDRCDGPSVSRTCPLNSPRQVSIIGIDGQERMQQYAVDVALADFRPIRAGRCSVVLKWISLVS